MTLPAPDLRTTTATTRAPALVWILGFAGLLPQLCALGVLLFGDREYAFAALATGYTYAALILSFVGGMWWGLAAQPHAETPRWSWFAAVAPSLAALACVLPWAVGAAPPEPGLVGLGVALLAALAIDVRLSALGLGPRWWLALRLPLSTGLAIITVAIGYAS